MTNNDLVFLTQNFANLVGLAFLGCKLLNSDARCIISSEWPGLISIHLKDCKEVTRSSVCSLFNCTALEDLLLRHNEKCVWPTNQDVLVRRIWDKICSNELRNMLLEEKNKATTNAKTGDIRDCEGIPRE
ncbi:PREDICTED: BTB/POZ domain-containing protein FBL11 [Theobroma cacao]|uniref:BTB/POZ domain-containing protein FBL11 n=1 Tax=Theobroma cacao TaxID=3641 RepID=A0AB32WY33_THECC|nr:PREDICTED: BTB/POZ domain-containing protein FBL11 [Theobroma cacao]